MFRLDIPRRGLATRALLAASLACCAGCAGSRGGARSWNPEAEGTTIGRDLRAAPRGIVAPATSLGVDLVEGRSLRDAALARAGGEAAAGDVPRVR